MSILVNIIDAGDPLPAYLFLKEHLQEGDKLLFIAAHGDEWMAQHISKVAEIDDSIVTIASMANKEDNHKYEHICRAIIPHLNKEEHYKVNLAGGTRYLCIAVEKVFELYQAQYFYVKTRENIIVSTIYDYSLYDNDDIAKPIRYRMTLAEYLTLHGLKHDVNEHKKHTPLKSPEAVHRFFRAYAYGNLTGGDFYAINLLRKHYRDMRNDLPIQQLIQKGIGMDNPKIPHLQAMLNRTGFRPAKSKVLTHEEVNYITGGWFEEYIYYLIHDSIHPDEIATGVRIARPNVGNIHNNELDVVFIKNNRLFVVECKSGIASEHLFNEIVYKSCALREALLGLTSYSYIFALRNDEEGRLKKIARMMNITFCDKEDFTGNGITDTFHHMRKLCQ